MSDPTGALPPSEGVTPIPIANKKSGTRVVEFGIIAVILGLVVAVAANQEPIGAFFRLRLWDKGAPSRTVEEFMGAVQKGDQQKAQSFIGASDLKPMVEGGKWQGFYTVSIAGRMDYLAQDLAPKQSVPKASDSEFRNIGDAAEVRTTLDDGKALKYRLKMTEGSWKILEILGGRPHHK